MGIMSCSRTAMAARYQHITAPIQRDITSRVGGLILQVGTGPAADVRRELRPEAETPVGSAWTFPASRLVRPAVAVGCDPTEACTSHAFEICGQPSAGHRRGTFLR